MQTPLRPTARGDRHLALHRCVASHASFMRPALQTSPCIGKAIFTLPMRAEVAWSSNSATSSLRRARPAFERCAIAHDIHDLPPSAPASSARFQSNLVEKNVYRGTKRFSVRAVSEKVGAVLKGHFVKISSVSSGVSSRTACSAADKASPVFFGAMYYNGSIRNRFRGIEWQSCFHVRVLVLVGCPDHEIFYCFL